jgi:hypothetical protein
MRLRSREGWNEKSNPASVLMFSSRLDAAPLAQAELLVEQLVDRLEGGDLAALELAQEVLQHLEGTRHPEADQMATDSVEGGGGGGHRAGSAAARRRPIAS